MNILVVGNGFIGKDLAKKLLAYGHFVSIIDIKSKPKKSLFKSEADYYQLDARSKECEDVFLMGQFDIVYFAIGDSNEESRLRSDNEINSLINMLKISYDFEVKKFVYISTTFLYDYETIDHAKVFGNYPEFFMYCTNKKICEKYCQIYNDFYKLDVAIIRVPQVYGPGQNTYGEGFIIHDIFDSFNKKVPDKIYSLFHNIELIYIADLSYLLANNIINEDIIGIYKIEGKLIDVYDVVKKVRKLFPDRGVRLRFRFDMKIKKSDEKNVIKLDSNFTHLKDGLDKVYEWFSRLRKETFMEKLKKISFVMSFSKNGKPWIEAIVFSFLIVMVGKYLNFTYDLAIVLIMIMGMVYGVRISLTSALLCFLFYYIPVYNKTPIDIFSIEKVFAYVSIALISGYKKSINTGSKEIQRDTYYRLEKLYGKVRNNLSESRKAASVLAEQLKTSENSYIKFYKIIKKLESSLSSIKDVIPDIIKELTGFKNVELIECFEPQDNLIGVEQILVNTQKSNEIYLCSELNNSIGAVIPLFNRITKKVDNLILIKDIPFENININTELCINLIHEIVTDYYEKSIKE